MVDFVEAIRIAVSPDATPEARAAGVQACRAVLQALDETLPQTPPAPRIDASQIANVVGALRGVSPDQLLELAIAKLRGALPAGTDVPRVEPLKFHIIPLPASKT